MNTEVREIELQIEQAREFIKLNEAMQRLRSNKDFEKVISEEYFKNESVRLVEAMSAPQLQDEKYQKAIHKSMAGIGNLKQFFAKVEHQAEMARSAIEEGNQALDDIETEGEA